MYLYSNFKKLKLFNINLIYVLQRINKKIKKSFQRYNFFLKLNKISP